MGEYAFEIIYGLITAAVTGIAGIIGMRIMKIVEKYQNNREMRAIARDTARWVEQLYKDFNSSDKAAKFDEAFADALSQHGIPFTALDVTRLREAAVNELNASDWKFLLEESYEEEELFEEDYESDEDCEVEELETSTEGKVEDPLEE